MTSKHKNCWTEFSGPHIWCVIWTGLILKPCHLDVKSQFYNFLAGFLRCLINHPISVLSSTMGISLLALCTYLKGLLQESRVECVWSFSVNTALGCSSIPTEIYSIITLQKLLTIHPNPPCFFQSKRVAAQMRIPTFTFCSQKMHSQEHFNVDEILRTLQNDLTS